eukprot:gene12097-25376_t
MGSVLDKFSSKPIYSELPSLRSWEAFFISLKLYEPDIGKLYKAFKKMIKDNGELLRVFDMLMYLDVDRTPFTERVITMFNMSDSGMIDFKKFVLVIWNYCTLGKTGLGLFAFDLYNKDGSKELTASELRNMLQDLYGANYQTNKNAT